MNLVDCDFNFCLIACSQNSLNLLAKLQSLSLIRSSFELILFECRSSFLNRAYAGQWKKGCVAQVIQLRLNNLDNLNNSLSV